MKVTIYTVSYCQFSKQEKEYLQQNNIPFEEKDLETDPKYLEEMLFVSNNFAGTPVTVINKDDGSQVVIKGFNKEELDKALGIQTDSITQSQVSIPQSQLEEKPQAQTQQTAESPTQQSSQQNKTQPQQNQIQANQTIPSEKTEGEKQTNQTQPNPAQPSTPQTQNPQTTQQASSPQTNNQNVEEDVAKRIEALLQYSNQATQQTTQPQDQSTAQQTTQTTQPQQLQNQAQTNPAQPPTPQTQNPQTTQQADDIQSLISKIKTVAEKDNAKPSSDDKTPNLPDF